MHTPRILSVAVLCMVMLLPSQAHPQKKLAAIKQEAFQFLDENRSQFEQAAADIYTYAETAFKEQRSSERLAALLEKSGFHVERGVAGIPTAFVATYGSGYPVVGVLAEYDALPGLSQVPNSTKKEPLEPGKDGHGCGHNLFGTGSTAAAMAVKTVMEKEKLPGTIKLFGCPAEETVAGKIYMAKAGVFDGVDVCLNWHPSTKNHASLAKTIAMNNFEIIFRGRTAHGAVDPWNGRSALDAVELMDAGVNFLREHVQPTVRIHYIIKNGGEAPNIVPDYAVVWYFVRDNTREGVEQVYQRVLKCAEGAALMTETTMEVNLITGTYEYLPNHELTRLLDRNLHLAGPPQYTEKDQAFAKELQRNLSVTEEGYSTGIEEYTDTETRGDGSTDVADVSRLVPTSGEMTIATMPEGIPWHSWAVATCAVSPAGYAGMMVAAKTLAASSIEAMMDTKIVENAHAEFKDKTKGFTYRSAVPDDKKPPID